MHASVVDPVAFCEGWLGADLWSTQRDIARAVAAHRRVAVKACHSSGKSWLAAHLALWWLTRYAHCGDAKVITTAPTWQQVHRILWGEIHRATARARQLGRIAFPKANQTELRLGPQHFAVGLSTNEGVRFQGFKGTMLLILDEAPGIAPDIWEAIEGARAGGTVHLLALGNPTVPGGPFWDAFARNREGWATFTINAFDTPNLAGCSLDDLLAMDGDALAVAPRPYLVTRQWVRESYDAHGPASPFWQARVLGEFPEQGDDALISLRWCEEATRRRVPDNPEHPIVVGIDVAGPGEAETVVVARRDHIILAEQAWSVPDPRGPVLAYLRSLGGRLGRVNVDAVGIGYGFALHLQDAFRGTAVHVNFVNVGEAARDAEKYRNLKAELYWGLRMRFQAGEIAGPLSDTAVSQLASIRYEHNARGQVEIESKADAVKRGVRSPDRAEAVMLAFAGVGGAVVQGSEREARPPVRFPRERFAA